ncbi:SDR family NAD(P)-dependent oxidoreductase [Metapseudomonas furukawaii]|jgi:NAD(P)-dependent dehydrogenase (short-subunit alcohol dehydrogenase family)|uniref:2,3-dihydroxy-2,3-dihydro-p-cumate dehydrogenase n=1 Tax=Metapseudomonas furukawaii TaxID=1149133 RepID=A0AAD1C0H5_METFU|nr:SDR family oxidoreductase [Pseudomonas furukawaii]ELS25890.1 3-oxoacyl-acyl-carrier protein reductase [Pseudomonas furukawaii]WAG76759.1 SDR family oxidoreductase [Pseudomonas furukawaii]BAU74708.1 short chain dehydrogenase [Pseudomonas furukawaii]
MTPSPIVIVTGGSRGIGRCIVERLQHDGFGVLFTHSSSDAEARELETALANGGPVVRALRADVADTGSAKRVFDAAEALGEVIGLVNNAGITGRLGPITQLDDAQLDQVLAVNLAGPIRLCREAARRWSGRDNAGRARIINISSVAARTGSPNEYVAYAATKAGLETLSIGLARELAPAGILVSAVSPGTVDTGIHARAGEPGRAQRVAARIPLGRPGQPEEIANAVAWLMSPEATYVTGTVINVAGGL